MAVSKQDVIGWFKYAKESGCSHVLVVRFIQSDRHHPVYVRPGTNVRARADEYKGSKMQEVVGVYSTKKSIDDQLKDHRAFHYD